MADINRIKSELEVQKANSNQRKKEIDKLKHEINVIEKDIESIKSDLSKETDKLKLFESRSGKAKEKLKEMATKYPWIDTERQFFGKPDSIYCFKDLTSQALEDLIKQLED